MVTSDSGSMSIVQFHLPTNQTAMVQSVIQPNHQSVIQQTNPISAIQVRYSLFLLILFFFLLNKIFSNNQIDQSFNTSFINLKLPKNVILVNKIAPGSVIQSTETEPV